MSEDTRFLALGVAMGYLAPDITGMILQLQVAAARRGSECLRVGDLLQQHELLGYAGCEAIAAEQEKRRAPSILYRVLAFHLDHKLASKLKFFVALLSALGVFGSVFYFLNPLAISLSVAGFIVMIISLALDYAATIERSIFLSLWHAIKTLFYFIVATLLGYGLYLATNLNLAEIVSRHTSPIQQEVRIWANDVMLALYMLNLYAHGGGFSAVYLFFMEIPGLTAFGSTIRRDEGPPHPC